MWISNNESETSDFITVWTSYQQWTSACIATRGLAITRGWDKWLHNTLDKLWQKMKIEITGDCISTRMGNLYCPEKVATLC